MLRLIVHPEHPEPRKVGHAVEALGRGGLVGYPTDTVYGLGCDYADRGAVERLYRLKGMSAKQPIAFLLPDLSEIARFGVVSNAAYRLMRRLIPGPYTFVLEATREVPRNLIIERKKRRSVGVRVVDHPIVAAMLAAHRRPILSTSAVGDDGVGLGDADEVVERYGRGLDVLVDGGPVSTEVSTVVSLVGDEFEVMRVGKGPVDLLEG
jgi:tRNA threonylcarbamoyl adenosine modification protein (Sua5/YciO/YrdC/YwlC family)